MADSNETDVQKFLLQKGQEKFDWTFMWLTSLAQQMQNTQIKLLRVSFMALGGRVSVNSLFFSAKDKSSGDYRGLDGLDYGLDFGDAEAAWYEFKAFCIDDSKSFDFARMVHDLFVAKGQYLPSLLDGLTKDDFLVIRPQRVEIKMGDVVHIRTVENLLPEN